MVKIGSTWLMLLKCSQCGETFSVKGIPATGIAETPNTTACPECGHKPGAPLVAPYGSSRTHLVLSLEKEKSH